MCYVFCFLLLTLNVSYVQRAVLEFSSGTVGQNRNLRPVIERATSTDAIRPKTNLLIVNNFLSYSLMYDKNYVD